MLTPRRYPAAVVFVSLVVIVGCWCCCCCLLSTTVFLPHITAFSPSTITSSSTRSSTLATPYTFSSTVLSSTTTAGNTVADEWDFVEECTYVDRTNEKTQKKKIVVLGSGWAAIKFLQTIDTTNQYDVTVVSPRNYFLFTPFLPSCVVGTVEPRSIVEPIRQLLRYEARPFVRKLLQQDDFDAESFVEARFLESACTKIDVQQNCVFCQDISAIAGPCDAFRLDYDKLIVAVGATTNTFNIPGVKEHAMSLKQVTDATIMRDRILDAFETAALQDDPAEKTKLCSFVVVGAGPTGVEFAAELDDHIREDLVNLYPNEVAAATVTLISSTDDLLSSYDPKISEFTKRILETSSVEVLRGVRVTGVTADSVSCKNKKDNTVFEVPSSLTLWSTGVKPGRLVQDMLTQIPTEQTKPSAGVLVDPTFKAYGTDNIYALGDCAVLSDGNSMVNDMDELFAKADADKSGSLDKKELLALFDNSLLQAKYPQASVFKKKIEEDFYLEIDKDGSGAVELDEFKEFLSNVDSTMRNLPPTAQVAGQQGTFLAKRWNGETDKGFKYFHKGSMAYVGQENAAAQVSMLKSLLPYFLQGIPIAGEDIILTGRPAEFVWRLLYLDMQISNRNKFQVGFDWTKQILFGRDTSRL